ncbi:MAG: ATP-binding protein [Candidatus Omnitrophota bacterium]|nr:ATP-binding protein [Candidatus Omnitrophota bacterium]
MENLRAGKAVSRCYRNRRIGEFLKELDMTEGRSTGIPKILRAMKNNGSPKPEFETDEDRTHFLIRLPIHLKANALAVEHSEAPVEAPVILTETDKKIIVSLKGRELARNELLHVLGYSQPTGNFKKAIEKLLQHALIERTIPDKPNSRLQKYRLTEKGKKRSSQ